MQRGLQGPATDEPATRTLGTVGSSYWGLISAYSVVEVIMLSPAKARMDDVSDKWAISAIRKKKLVITAFLNEYGENATWEEWRSFLHEHRVKGFDWIRSMD